MTHKSARLLQGHCCLIQKKKMSRGEIMVFIVACINVAWKRILIFGKARPNLNEWI